MQHLLNPSTGLYVIKMEFLFCFQLEQIMKKIIPGHFKADLKVLLNRHLFYFHGKAELDTDIAKDLANMLTARAREKKLNFLN